MNLILNDVVGLKKLVVSVIERLLISEIRRDKQYEVNDFSRYTPENANIFKLILNLQFFDGAIQRLLD